MPATWKGPTEVRALDNQQNVRRVFVRAVQRSIYPVVCDADDAKLSRLALPADRILDEVAAAIPRYHPYDFQLPDVSGDPVADFLAAARWARERAMCELGKRDPIEAVPTELPAAKVEVPGGKPFYIVCCTALN